ncbi:MAG: Rieske 2Fe-2S domain-containing protein [Rhodothermia bacterium]|nr:Rieske 2Fe-2S domain-containing protein [Rhodothermia bacterium]
MKETQKNRRAFLKDSCSVLTAFGLAAYGINMTGCDTTDEPIEGITIVGKTMTIDQTVVTALNVDKGFLMSGAAKAIVLNDGGTIRAFSNVCPHEGNPVTQFDGNQIRCIHHGWTFSSNGTKTGIAQKNLTALAVSKNGNTLTITLL